MHKKQNKLFKHLYRTIKINFLYSFTSILILFLYSLVSIFPQAAKSSLPAKQAPIAEKKISKEEPKKNIFQNEDIFSQSDSYSYELEKKIQTWKLEEIETYAVSNNPLYLAEKQNIGMARGDLITSALYRNPVLSYQQQFIPLNVTESFTSHGPSVGTNGVAYQNYRQNLPGGVGGPQELAPSVSWEYDFGIIRNQKMKVATQQFQGQIAQFADFDRMFRLRLRQNYWLHLYLTELINFQKEFYENYQDLLDLNRFRAEKGDIALLEYDRLELERIRIERDYKDADILRAQIAKELRLLIGVAPSNQILNFRGKLQFNTTQELGINLSDFNIEDRPDLQALKSKAIQNKLTIDLRKKEGYTSYLNFGGEVRLKGNEQYAGVYASIPLKVFDRNQGEILKAEENYKKSQLEVEYKRKQIYSEIRAALREVIAREELLLNYREIKLLDKNKDVQEKYRLAYIRGASNLVTFLEAEKNYFTVLKGYFEQLYLYYNSIEVFRAAIGKLGNINE
ncbi:MAG TPA: TolC family protein [Leptospiraceae bacterium]|nr:TolC family protein [Leptospiraceae bacterium]HMX31072.1 TolC family protein [Leptospiraceae bacterium]HMY31888.1 TolC family protein [Leptospiraceae bacterium]HMZ65246.1 TolC family protein [Leptospiraceae bacterium]HNA06297.1 TolC family protein [Leptospiraceae bacterium]